MAIARHFLLSRRKMAAVMTLGALRLPACFGAQEQESFEAAAIKRVEEGPLYPKLDINPAFLTARAASLHFLILQAFGLEDFQLLQTADWMRSELYSIHATSGKAVSSTQMMAMLRDLLAKRFRLVCHRETRELSVYALVVDKNGSKLQPPGQADDPHYWKQTGDRVTQSIGTSVPDLVRYLNSRTGLAAVGLPVVDQTGLRDLYKIHLTFEVTWNPETKSGRFDIDYQRDLPNQLGLRLRPTKAPVPLLIVDSAQRPSME